MAAYSDADTIADLLGVAFTLEQEAQADRLCQQVTAFIDTYTGRSWQGTSPVTGELRNVLPPTTADGFGLVYLAHVPAVAVSAVSLRTAYPNVTETALAADQFELVETTSGILTLVASACYGYPSLLALVDYTYANAVPADITLAAEMIISGQMARLLAVQAGAAAIAENPQLAGLESIALGQNDISIKVASSINSGSLAGSGSAKDSSWVTPGSAVAALLDPYRRVVIA